MPGYRGMNHVFLRRQLIYVLATGSDEVKEALNYLTTQELKVLQNNRDLLGKVKEIAHMGIDPLLEELESEYDFEIEYCNSGDVVIDPEEVVVRVMKENVPVLAGGWFLNYHSGAAEKWAKKFLMQDVRVELMFRYFNHKSDEKEREDDKNIRALRAMHAGGGWPHIGF